MGPAVSMTEAEKAFLEGHLAQSRTYWEWGMGHSTLWALARTPALERIVSVEGGYDYLRDWARKQPAIVAAEEQGRLFVRFSSTFDAKPDTPPEGRWRILGDPYSRCEPGYDLALVDGRFRVACALSAALMNTPHILIHDFSVRPYYAGILTYCEVLRETDTFVCVRRRAGIMDAALQEAMEDAYADPR